MKVLIVHAHEEPHSFLGALKRTALETLEAGGHSVVISDLYRMGWKAVADGADFLERRDPHRLQRQMEEVAAGTLGTLSHDIMEEQAKLRSCDGLILQFPLWWASMPAILKGWVDRVFTQGFAYRPDACYETGLLKGRKAMLCLSTGAPESAFQEGGLYGAMDRILHPIQHGILAFCGFEVLPPFVAFAPGQADESERRAMLGAYAERLRGI